MAATRHSALVPDATDGGKNSARKGAGFFNEAQPLGLSAPGVPQQDADRSRSGSRLDEARGGHLRRRIEDTSFLPANVLPDLNSSLQDVALVRFCLPC